MLKMARVGVLGLVMPVLAAAAESGPAAPAAAQSGAAWPKGQYAALNSLPDWGGVWVLNRPRRAPGDPAPEQPQFKGEYLARYQAWQKEVRENNGVARRDTSNCMPPGMPNMGKFLGSWFLYLLFVSYTVALVCGQTLTKGPPYMLGFKVAGAVAFAGYSYAQIPAAIWWGRPWKSALKEFADGILYAALTAGTFGWLWPE